MKKATFAMGCFWHPDALFGCQAGVFRTRVGYTSGTLPNPTYRNLGDHTEAIDIEYYSKSMNYNDLLNLFWKNHDPKVPQKRQYRSAIFCRDEEQKELANESKKKMEETIGCKVLTSIEDFKIFYNAEDYHQKYYLQTHHTKLFKSLGIKTEALIDSDVAAKLNGFVVAENNLASFNEYNKKLKLSDENTKYVQNMIAKGKQAHC